MSIELDDIASAFADLQKRTDKIVDRETRSAIDRAIDALLMGMGSLELRLHQLEHRRSMAIPKIETTMAPTIDGFAKLIVKN